MMSYDLALRRRLPRSFARESASPAPRGSATMGAQLVVAGSVLLFPLLLRRAEIHRCRQEYSGSLSTTREMPAVSMSDLVYGSEEKP